MKKLMNLKLRHKSMDGLIKKSLLLQGGGQLRGWRRWCRKIMCDNALQTLGKGVALR